MTDILSSNVRADKNGAKTQRKVKSMELNQLNTSQIPGQTMNTSPIKYVSKTVKFFAGFILFIPLTAIAFGIHCFSEDKWPWSNNL